jgi:hypothetical protein
MKNAVSFGYIIFLPRLQRNSDENDLIFISRIRNKCGASDSVISLTLPSCPITQEILLRVA